MFFQLSLGTEITFSTVPLSTTQTGSDWITHSIPAYYSIYTRLLLYILLSITHRSANMGKTKHTYTVISISVYKCGCQSVSALLTTPNGIVMQNVWIENDMLTVGKSTNRSGTRLSITGKGYI
jgi:hypothetical protein